MKKIIIPIIISVVVATIIIVVLQIRVKETPEDTVSDDYIQNDIQDNITEFEMNYTYADYKSNTEISNLRDDIKALGISSYAVNSVLQDIIIHKYFNSIDSIQFVGSDYVYSSVYADNIISELYIFNIDDDTINIFKKHDVEKAYCILPSGGE